MKKHLALGSLLVLCFALGRLTSLSPVLAQEGTTPSEDSPTREAGTAMPDQPRYLEAMRAELAAMRIEGASCERTDAQRGGCRFTQRGSSSGREFEIRLAYSDVTDTVYLHIPRYIVAASDAPTTDRVMRRLMELNWTMLLGKFEWDPTDGEVRLAMIVNTDSNFDRRAFRSAVRSIAELADRYHNELVRMQTAE